MFRSDCLGTVGANGAQHGPDDGLFRHEGQLGLRGLQDILAGFVAIETPGVSTTEEALRRIAAAARVSYGFLWSLRYRPPKRIELGPSLRLVEAYRRACLRQIQKLEHEIAITERVCPDASADRVAKARALVDEARKVLAANDEA